MKTLILALALAVSTNAQSQTNFNQVNDYEITLAIAYLLADNADCDKLMSMIPYNIGGGYHLKCRNGNRFGLGHDQNGGNVTSTRR